VSFAAITLCVASQQVFIVISVISLSTQSGNFRIHPDILFHVLIFMQRNVFRILMKFYLSVQ
jgi:hypothetical protein